MKIGWPILPIFLLKSVVMATSLERSQNGFGNYESFHRTTNPENLVKIGPVVSEITCS